jgi:hypothetical protein
VFRTSTGLGEVCVSALDTRVLVAVAELSCEAGIGVVVALFAFGSTLGAVGIIFGNLGHSNLRCEVKVVSGQSHFPRTF